MIIAIIDLGTNTFNLLIADVKTDGTHKKLFKTKIPTKLGEGSINKNLISKDAFKRGIAALKTKKELIRKFNAERTYAFATSAIRNARNGKLFIKAAQEEAGIHVQVITGIKEAELIYHGVKSALTIGEEPALIMDIGGGSNEYIIGTDKEILWKGSFDIGVARLLAEFKPSDPITHVEIEKIEEHIENKLQPLFEAVKNYNITELIGASGSFDTFASIIDHQFYDQKLLKHKTEFQFNLHEFDLVHQQLLLSTKDQRFKIKGLIPMRVDMIVLASIMIKHHLRKLNISKMRLSTHALKEGMLMQIMARKI